MTYVLVFICHAQMCLLPKFTELTFDNLVACESVARANSSKDYIEYSCRPKDADVPADTGETR